MSISIDGTRAHQYANLEGFPATGRNDLPGRKAAGEGKSSAEVSQSGPEPAKNVTAKGGDRFSITDPQSLPPEARAEVASLKSRDAEVRAHEQAHVAAGGQYVRGAAKYEYSTGPDGRRYAVSGEVSIDTSSVPNNPRATIAKMEAVKKAALAPSQPSSQDRSVAAAADKSAAQAQRELTAMAMKGRPSMTRGGFQAKGTLIEITV